MEITAKNQSIDEFINNKMPKIRYFSMQMQTLKVLADMMYKETKSGPRAKSVITPVAHNPLLTDAAAPKPRHLSRLEMNS